MNTEPTARCPQCGTALPPNARAGLCPRCLMEMNLKTETVLSGEAPQAQPPLPPEQIAPFFPQLEILECLGRGGMGVVYKARQKSLNRLVALKLIAPERAGDPQFAARFEKEARALAALNHPNIVTIHDHGQAGGFYYLLMEYVDGITLRQLLVRERISAREALAIVPQICDALQFAHDQGIIHRDIKPENILIDRRGRVKVADFGLAKIVGGDASSPEAGSEAAGGGGLTEAGKVMGTPQYMSPEQIQAPGEVDHRADIYALGVVFYQMLTGELPGKKIEPPSKKVSIDVRLDEIVLRALEKKPELRYQQASVLKTQVETIAEKSETPTVPSPIEARFSWLAIAGAIWTAWFFTVVPLFLWHLAVTHQFARPGTFDPTEMFLISVFIMLPTVAAPLGTTLLGLIAVSQIRHSAGKRYGLGLALFDSLLFPLLALDLLIFGVLGNVVPQSIGHRWALLLLLLLFLVLGGLDFWIIRRVWRTTHQPEARWSWQWLMLVPLVLAYLLSTVAVQKREPSRTIAPDPSGIAVHYSLFEVEAARVDQLVPPQTRQRGDETADPNAVHFGGIPNTVSQMAEISPTVLYLLEAGTDSFMGSQRDVAMWPAMADGGTFAGRKRVGQMNGFVGARRAHGTWQLRLNYYLAHVVADGESTMAELYYEGDAPQRGAARVFLIPFTDDDVKKYVVVEFDVTAPTGSPAPNLTRSTNPNNMGMNYGPETNGLQALLELQTTNGRFAIGEPIAARFFIRNVSLTNIDIAGASWRQDDGSHISITDSSGKEFPVQHIDYSFWVQTQRNHLKPGESVTFDGSGLEFLPEGTTGKDLQNPVGNYLIAPPGKYSIRYRLHFPDIFNGDVPWPSDWVGDLETEPLVIRVHAAGTPDISFGPVQEIVNTNFEHKMISLESVKTVTELPPELERELKNGLTDIVAPVMNLTAWMRTQGLDVIYEQDIGIRGLDLKLQALDTNAWKDMSAPQAQQAIETAATNGLPVARLDNGTNNPTVYAFETRQGARGLLECFSDSPNDCNWMIRYKLLRPAAQRPETNR